MIESIQIKNFRGIHKGQVDRFARFNLLIGPNNSGKSALLEALYLAATASRRAALVDKESNAVYDALVPDHDLLDYHSLRRVWRKHNLAERQPDLGTWRDGLVLIHIPDKEFPFRAFELSTAGEGFLQDEAQETGVVGIKGSEGNREQGIERAVETMLGAGALPFADKRLTFLWHRALTYNWQGSAAWLVEGNLPTARRVLFFDVAMMQSHLPLAFYQEMLGVPRWADQIALRFGSIFDIEDPLVQFAPRGDEGRWVQGHIGPRDGRLLPVDSYGDGARSAFKVLAPLIALAELAEDEPGLFLWEEPELFQHPQSLERLLAAVAQIVQDRPIQIFISTQSLEVIGCFLRLLQQKRLEEDALVTIRLNLSEGSLHSSRFEPRHLVAWLDDRLDPRVWEPLASSFCFRLKEE